MKRKSEDNIEYKQKSDFKKIKSIIDDNIESKEKDQSFIEFKRQQKIKSENLKENDNNKCEITDNSNNKLKNYPCTQCGKVGISF